MTRRVSATQFKTQCLALLDRVATRQETLIISKHGRPIARLVPIDDVSSKPLIGSVRIIDREDDLLSTGEVWDAERVEP